MLGAFHTIAIELCNGCCSLDLLTIHAEGNLQCMTCIEICRCTTAWKRIWQQKFVVLKSGILCLLVPVCVCEFHVKEEILGWGLVVLLTCTWDMCRRPSVLHLLILSAEWCKSFRHCHTWDTFVQPCKVRHNRMYYQKVRQGNFRGWGWLRVLYCYSTMLINSIV